MNNLSKISVQTLDGLFGPGLLQAFGFNERALDVEMGTWLSDLYELASGNNLPAGITMLAEVNHTIGVETSTTANANGGNMTLNAGAKTAGGSGTDGVLALGASGTSRIELGNSNASIKFNSPIQAGANSFLLTDPGNAGTLPVTYSGTFNMSPTGLQTRTMPDPTFIDQEIMLVNGSSTPGNSVRVNFAHPYNFAGNDAINLAPFSFALIKGVKIDGNFRWYLISSDNAGLVTNP